MSVIYIVLPLALIFVVVALFVFIRAVRAGQFDDMDTPSLRVLHDDTSTSRPPAAPGVDRTSAGSRPGTENPGQSGPRGAD